MKIGQFFTALAFFNSFKHKATIMENVNNYT